MSNATLDHLDAVLSEGLQLARVPGACAAAIVSGQTVYAKAFGVRDIATRAPMTLRTRYPIASTTKAFNATLIGALVSEGLLSWDNPIQSYLPTFHIFDPSISSQITIRDLLTMRTGLPRHDWIWYGIPQSRTELCQRISSLATAFPFRDRFIYSNISAIVAGYVAEQKTGLSWEQLVEDRFLRPLAMSHTGFIPDGSETITYHEDRTRSLLATHWHSADVTAPSGGSILSTVIDMTKWLRHNLRSHAFTDEVSPVVSVAAEVHAPALPARTDPVAPTPDAFYAMGWFVDQYEGRKRVVHGGYLHDADSEVVLIPELDMGLVAFTNFGPPGIAKIINQHILSALTGMRVQATFPERVAQYEQKISENIERRRNAKRILGTGPSHRLADYAGTYANKGYGSLSVVLNSDRLELQRGEFNFGLVHWHFDSWVVTEMDWWPVHSPFPFDEANPILFNTSAAGEIVSLEILFEPSTPPIVFTKVLDK